MGDADVTILERALEHFVSPDPNSFRRRLNRYRWTDANAVIGGAQDWRTSREWMGRSVLQGGLSATIGSTRAARRARMIVAASATISRRSATTPNVHGSRSVTLYRRFASRRV